MAKPAKIAKIFVFIAAVQSNSSGTSTVNCGLSTLRADCGWRSGLQPLLVPERFNRIEVRRLERRISAEHDADHRANDQADDDPIDGNDRREFEEESGRI